MLLPSFLDQEYVEKGESYPRLKGEWLASAHELQRHHVAEQAEKYPEERQLMANSRDWVICSFGISIVSSLSKMCRSSPYVQT
jgi:hypothetical protein